MAPPTETVARVDGGKSHFQMFFTFAPGVAALPLVDLRTFDSLALSVALGVSAGVRLEFISWDKPDDVGSKSVFSIAFGGLAAGGKFGAASLPTEQMNPDGTQKREAWTGSAAVFGGYLQLKVAR